MDDLSLSIARGELFSLLGLNGAGKATTIKMLSCGCDSPLDYRQEPPFKSNREMGSNSQ